MLVGLSGRYFEGMYMKMNILVCVLIIFVVIGVVVEEDWYFFLYGVEDMIGVLNFLSEDGVKSVVSFI